MKQENDDLTEIRKKIEQAKERGRKEGELWLTIIRRQMEMINS